MKTSSVQPKSIRKVGALKGIGVRLVKWTLPIVLAVIWLVLALVSPYFMTYDNLFNLARQTAIVGIVATGMTYVIISGGIDLSVGSVMALAGTVLSLLLKAGTGTWVSIATTLILSALVGLINGVVIHEGRVPPFIATLGMMSAARGAALLLAGGRLISGLPRSFTDFAQLSIWGVPSLVWVLAAVVLLASFVLSRTRFGRNVYAIGSSIEASRLSGINIRWNTYMIYTVSAFGAGLAGILLTSRLAAGIPSAAAGYELDAIAASVIGGASLSGAEGTILGTILGAFIMSTLRNGGNLLGVDPFWLEIAIGILIVVAVFIDQMQRKKQA